MYAKSLVVFPFAGLVALSAAGWNAARTEEVSLRGSRGIQDTSRRFDRVQLLEADGVTSASVSLGDLDRDGDLDLVLAKGRHWPLQNMILMNDGKARFVATPLADSADRTYSAALADLDGDGDLDMVVSNDRPDRKLVYINDGAAAFGRRAPSASRRGPRAM